MFNVNVSGKISPVSKTFMTGIALSREDSEVIGQNRFDELVGVPVSWRDNVPKTQPVIDSLVF